MPKSFKPRAGAAPQGHAAPSAQLPRDIEEEIRRTRDRPGDSEDAISRLARAIELLERGDPRGAVAGGREGQGDGAAVGRRPRGARAGLLRRRAAGRRRSRSSRRTGASPGASDQNHLIADCLRGLGRPDGGGAARRGGAARPKAPNEAKAEAVIVAASALADQRRFAEALAFLGTRADARGRRARTTRCACGTCAATSSRGRAGTTRPPSGVPQGDAPRRRRVRRGGAARCAGLSLARRRSRSQPLAPVPREPLRVHPDAEPSDVVALAGRAAASASVSNSARGRRSSERPRRCPSTSSSRRRRAPRDRVGPRPDPRRPRGRTPRRRPATGRSARSGVRSAARADPLDRSRAPRSTSTSGGGSAGRKHGGPREVEPIASPVNTAPVAESCSAT